MPKYNKFYSKIGVSDEINNSLPSDHAWDSAPKTAIVITIRELHTYTTHVVKNIFKSLILFLLEIYFPFFQTTL